MDEDEDEEDDDDDDEVFAESDVGEAAENGLRGGCKTRIEVIFFKLNS